MTDNPPINKATHLIIPSICVFVALYKAENEKTRPNRLKMRSDMLIIMSQKSLVFGAKGIFVLNFKLLAKVDKFTTLFIMYRSTLSLTTFFFF